MRAHSQPNSGQSWKQLVFYGEVVGFALAWVIGIVALTHEGDPDSPVVSTVNIDTYAEVGLSELRGEELK